MEEEATRLHAWENAGHATAGGKEEARRDAAADRGEPACLQMKLQVCQELKDQVATAIQSTN